MVKNWDLFSAILLKTHFRFLKCIESAENRSLNVMYLQIYTRKMLKYWFESSLTATNWWSVWNGTFSAANCLQQTFIDSPPLAICIPYMVYFSSGHYAKPWQAKSSRVIKRRRYCWPWPDITGRSPAYNASVTRSFQSQSGLSLSIESGRLTFHPKPNKQRVASGYVLSKCICSKL